MAVVVTHAIAIGEIMDNAGVAQLVEHHVANVNVVGSSPITRSIIYWRINVKFVNASGLWTRSWFDRLQGQES
tara:strand:+ start:380 stop:598 length:219 start_codon:yes stop_codon:yes gene_type:complete